MARFYPPGGGSSGTGGSSIDLDQITAPRRLVAMGYKTITSDSTGEIVEGTMPKLGAGEFYAGSDESPDALSLSKIYAASHTTQVGSFDFILYGYFDNTESGSTRVRIPNCTPANIAAGVKVGSTDQYLMGEYTNDANATASDLKRYATMYVKGEKIEGTMPVNFALNSTINAGESVEISEGYYPAGKITANSLSSQTTGTAVATDIKNNKTAWVNGVLVTGTMAIREALNSTMNAGDIINIPEGYYPAGKITANTLESQTSGTGIASDIKKGKTVWVNGVLITGTMTVNTKIESIIDAGDSVTIPEGYHPAGKVSATSLADQTAGNAVASDMKDGKTAWANGLLVTGSMTINPSISQRLIGGDSVDIPEGYYLESKITVASLASQTPGTAGVADIISGKTAWAYGVLLTGTIVKNEAIVKTIDAGESVVIPEGYYMESTITASSMGSQTKGTAIASDIKKDKTAWVNGVLITGSMAINAAINRTINAGDIITIPEGYYPASKVTASSLASQTAGTAISSDIKDGKTAWIDGVLVTGDMVINPIVAKSLNCGESTSIPEGYILGATITANSLESQTAGTATPTDLLENETAWVNGEKIEGTIPVKTAINTTLNAGGSINIPEGYYPTGVVKATALSLQTVGSAVASDMKKDKTAWVNGVLVTGTMAVYNAIERTIDAGESVILDAGYYPKSTITATGMGSQTEGTAKITDILLGKTAWVNGVLLTGTMANNPAINSTLNAGGSINIPAGYTPGGKVSAKSLADQTSGTAVASDIKSSKTAWVNGVLVTGSMEIKSAVIKTLDAGESIVIPEGYYMESTITASGMGSQTEGTAIASDIKKSKTAWVNGVLVTGSMAINTKIDSTINAGKSVTISEGYHPAGKVTAASLVSQTSGTATADDLLENETAWVDGEKIEGTIPVKTAISATLNAGASLDIPAGYYPAGSVKTASLASQTSGTAIATDMKKGTTAWVNGILVIGTMSINGATTKTLNAGDSYTVPEGYTSGGKITAASLESQTTGTAVASDIKSTKTAWVDGTLVTGTMAINAAINKTINAGETATIAEGYYLASTIKATSLANQTAGTAVATDIKKDKTAWVDGILVTGSMVINAAINKTINAGETATIAEGYYLAGSVKGASLASQTVANAVAGDIITNKTAWINGVLVKGTMPVNAKIDTTLSAGGSISLSAGYYPASSIKAASLSSQTSATAIASDMKKDKTAWVNGVLVTGTMSVYSAINSTLAAGGSINIPAGYYPASKVTAKSLADQTAGTAVASDIKNTKTAWVGGLLVTGTMPVKAAINTTLNAGSSIEMPAGYYPTSKVTAKSLADQTSATATADHILSGDTAWVNGVLVTGSMPNIIATDPAKSFVFPTTPANNTYFYARISKGAHITDASSGYPEVQIPQSMVATAAKITADKLKVGETICGVAGTFTSDATATAEDIVEGKTAYVNGEKLEGNCIPYDMVLSVDLLPKVFDNFPSASMLSDTQPRQSPTHPATRFVVSKTPPSANITKENNGLSDLTSLQTGSILSWYEISEIDYNYECTQYIWSKYDKIIVIYAYGMFANYIDCKSIDLSIFDFKYCCEFTRMFAECISLTSLDLSTMVTPSGVFTKPIYRYSLSLSFYEMFSQCSSLTNINYGDNFKLIDNLNDVILQNNGNPTYQMFENCPANKPTGGNWDIGIWDIEGPDIGTYHIPTYLASGPVVNDILNKNVSVLQIYNPLRADKSITITVPDSAIDISVNGDESIMTWSDESLSPSTQYIYQKSDKIILNSNCYRLFKDCANIESFDIDIMDSRNVTNMSNMFENCSSAVTISMGDFITPKLTNMASMFANCTSLLDVVFSNFNTSNVTSMRSLFNNCASMRSVNLSNFDTSKVTDMYAMFYKCTLLRSLDLSKFDTSSVTTMESIFANCSSLTSLDLSSWNTSKVTAMNSMFYNCSSLTSLNVSSFSTSNVNNMTSMFYNCLSLASLDISSWNTSKVTNMRSMFNKCTSLYELDLSNFDTRNATTMAYMFYGAEYPITYGSNFVLNDTIYNTAVENNVNTNMTYGMFYESTANKPTGGNWDFGGWNTNGTFLKAAMLASGSNVNKAINKSATSFVRSTTEPAASVTTTDISANADSSIVTWYDEASKIQYWYSERVTIYLNSNSFGTFSSCLSLTTIDISGWDSSKVTIMATMFANCTSLTTLDISHFDTSNVVSMNAMFTSCRSLTSLDLPHFDTSKVTDMMSIFNNCSALTSLDASSFNTSNVTNMSYMFGGCSSLSSLNVSSFDTSKVTSMQNMFGGCSSLSSLNVSSFDTSKVTSMQNMFDSTSLLASITYGQKFVLNDDLLPLCVRTNGANPTFQMFKGTGGIDGVNMPSGGNWYSGVWIDGTFLSETTFATGELVNKAINKSCKSFEKSYELPTGGTKTTDISANNDKSILTWFDETSKIQYWYAGYATAYLNPNCYKMFNMCAELIEISFAYWNMSKVTNMAWMYANCTKLSIADDIYGVDTSKVTDMSNMFYYCQALTSLDLSTWDTSNVESLEGTFLNCTNLRDLKISTWDTSNVTTMWQLFDGCISLDALDLYSWNTAKVTNMGYTFSSCNLLTSLDIWGWDTSKVTNMQYMFSDMGLIYDINYGGNFVLPQTIFETCTADDEYINMTYGMFYNTSVNPPTGGNWDNGRWIPGGTFLNNNIAYLATGEEVRKIFIDSMSATSIVRSSTAPAASVTTTDISRNKDGSIVYWYDSALKTRYYYSKAPTIMMNPDSSRWFYPSPAVTSIDLRGWDSSEVVDMHMMFAQCDKLTSLDLSKWNTSKVVNMDSMFFQCSSLTSLDLSNFDTSNVTNMSGMFDSCGSLKTIKLSSFNTSKVIDMSSMFRNCSSLVSLDLSSFNTSNIDTMMNMFADTPVLTSITFGNQFILGDIQYSNCIASDGMNPTLEMFSDSGSTQKPTGGNWNLGVWIPTGTFLKNI